MMAVQDVLLLSLEKGNKTESCRVVYGCGDAVLTEGSCWRLSEGAFYKRSHANLTLRARFAIVNDFMLSIVPRCLRKGRTCSSNGVHSLSTRLGRPSSLEKGMLIKAILQSLPTDC